ncbi:CoA-binding protein [Bryobacter aggregatus]|uniref:CoA-binding protein n=1 Tax=Bryobacter aggregatus TaxID=360054 RepID=UPI00068C4921|nr:CoA-binding protein [Bryobacter aggregatus]
MRTIEQILRESKTIAVVGLSGNPERTSFGVAKALQHYGYKIIPVNPNETEVLGEKAYAHLSDVPVPIDIVNVFRRADQTPPIAAEAVAVGAKALWLQLGIENEDAKRIAEAGGLDVVMDHCIMVEHRKLRL